MRPEILASLRPYQREPAQRLLNVLQTKGAAFDLSETGTGKTYIGAAIAAELQVPSLVVLPKIADSAWKRASELFNDSTSRVGWEMLRTGNTPFGRWEHGNPPPREQRLFFKCQCCQRKFDSVDELTRIPCSAHWAGIHCVETLTRPHKYGKFIFDPRIRLLIFDEVHRAAGDSLNADMVIAAKQQGIPTLGLTATLACSPLQLRATGYLAGIHRLGDFDTFCARRGCRRVPMRGIQWLASKDDQDRIMRDIGAQLIPDRGIRITEADIEDFPARSIMAELYDLPEEDTEELNRLYKLLEEPLGALQACAMSDKDPEHPLTKRLRARQRIELLKVPVAEELGRDYLEKGNSVVFFVNFRQTIDQLLRRFPGAGVIDGTVVGEARDYVIDKFQANQNRELIVNNQAGGIALSLHDLHGSCSRVGIVFPADSPVVMHQLFGRLARSGGKSAALYRIIFAARTVEVKMRRSLELKYNNLAALKNTFAEPHFSVDKNARVS